MNRRWLAAILIALMGISMISGCSKKAEEESAQAGEYYEGGAESSEEEGDQSKEEGNSSNSGKEEQNAHDEEGEVPDQSVSNGGSGQNSASDSKGEGSDSSSKGEQSDKGNSGGSSSSKGEQSSGSSGSSGENNTPSHQGNGGSGEKEEPSTSDEEELIELDYGWIDQDDESLYKDIAISKTPAKTADGVAYYKENKIKVVSYNIRCADDPDGNSVDEREWRLDEVLNKYDADIMGFQEVTEGWEGRLHLMLSDEYDYVMVYRSEDGGKEANPIFYKPSKFKLLDAGYFWLSETPEEMGKGWGADHYRICTWVKLKVRKTGAEFVYFNTHVDYKPEPQVPSAELLIRRMKSISGGLGGIVTGDFNLTHSAAAYSTMCTYFADSNMATVKNTEQGTFPNYGKNKNGGSIIDYCFFTPKTMKAINYKVMTDLVDGKYVSDHFGVCSEVIIL